MLYEKYSRKFPYLTNYLLSSEYANDIKHLLLAQVANRDYYK